MVVPNFAHLLAPAPGTRQRLLGEFAPSDAPMGAFFRRSPDAHIKDATWNQRRAQPPQLKYASKRAGELRWSQRQQQRVALAG